MAGARAYPHSPGHIAVLILATTVVLWLAHVYAHALGESVARDRRLTIAELRHVARHEGAIVEAALIPCAALFLGICGLISTRSATWVALAAGLAVLAVQGFMFARVERMGWRGTLLIVGVNLTLGVTLIALKLLVTH